MPIYEFECKTCNQVFEELVRCENDERKLSCPKCGGRKVHRLFSVFGVAGAEKRVKTSGSSCSCCSSRNCGNCS